MSDTVIIINAIEQPITKIAGPLSITFNIAIERILKIDY